MFENIKLAPPDPIFALMHEFKSDQREGKIDLTVGVYKDESGNTPILKSVKNAERQMLECETTKSYLGIGGLDLFNEWVCKLVLGNDHPAISSQRALTIQSPGATGALRISGDFVAHSMPGAKVWCSKPTWSNHISIFEAAGVEIGQYSFLKENGIEFDFATMLENVRNISDGDAILLHTCCHNPTGFDPDRQQWKELLSLIAEKNLTPIFDFAYQGFFRSIEEDRWQILQAVELGMTVLVCNSFSKNMGLYSERVGGLTLVAESEAVCQALISQFKLHARTIYSNPPKHGAYLAALILSDEKLRQDWVAEVDSMRNSLDNARQMFVEKLQSVVPDRDWSHISQQSGMFSYSGLNAEQARRLRSEFAVYLLDSGRINVAGIKAGNVDRLCESIATVCKASVAS